MTRQIYTPLPVIFSDLWDRSRTESALTAVLSPLSAAEPGQPIAFVTTTYLKKPLHLDPILNTINLSGSSGDYYHENLPDRIDILLAAKMVESDAYFQQALEYSRFSENVQRPWYDTYIFPFGVLLVQFEQPLKEPQSYETDSPSFQAWVKEHVVLILDKPRSHHHALEITRQVAAMEGFVASKVGFSGRGRGPIIDIEMPAIRMLD